MDCSEFIGGENEMVQCPYNKSHLIKRARFQRHIVKCRKSYPDMEIVQCPFSAIHLIPEPELSHHVSICPEKALITSFKYNVNHTVKKEEIQPSAPVPVECDDNWDNVNVKTYNPENYATKAKVLRHKAGDLPSVRREFREAERKRLNSELVDNEEDTSKEVAKKIKKITPEKVLPSKTTAPPKPKKEIYSEDD